MLFAVPSQAVSVFSIGAMPDAWFAYPVMG